MNNITYIFLYFIDYDIYLCIYLQSRKYADNMHQNVMRLLVRRYITEMQRKADEKPVTEDDINEVKQDISIFRLVIITV